MKARPRSSTTDADHPDRDRRPDRCGTRQQFPQPVGVFFEPGPPLGVLVTWLVKRPRPSATADDVTGDDVDPARQQLYPGVSGKLCDRCAQRRGGVLARTHRRSNRGPRSRPPCAAGMRSFSAQAMSIGQSTCFDASVAAWRRTFHLRARRRSEPVGRRAGSHARPRSSSCRTRFAGRRNAMSRSRRSGSAPLLADDDGVEALSSSSPRPDRGRGAGRCARRGGRRTNAVALHRARDAGFAGLSLRRRFRVLPVAVCA